MADEQKKPFRDKSNEELAEDQKHKRGDKLQEKERARQEEFEKNASKSAQTEKGMDKNPEKPIPPSNS